MLAAQYHRKLQTLGVTVRKTIDSLIATKCIVSNHQLLHDDKASEPFIKHLGLSSVI